MNPKTIQEIAAIAQREVRRALLQFAKGQSGNVSLGAGATNDPNALHTTEAGEISALTEKTTPVDDDILLLEDSAASYAKKKVKISSLPTGGGGGGGDTTEPACRVYRTSNQSIASDYTPEIISFDTVDRDDNDWFDAGSNGIIVPEDGWYHIEAQVYWNGHPGVNGLYIQANGTGIGIDVNPSHGDYYGAHQAAATKYLGADTLITVLCGRYGGSTGELIGGVNNTWLAVSKIVPGSVGGGGGGEGAILSYFEAQLLSDQAGTNQTWIEVPATTEIVDNGSNYDAAGSRWTPPAGYVIITAILELTNPDSDVHAIALAKNGTIIEPSVKRRNMNTPYNNSINGTWHDVSDGNDYYELQFYRYSGGATIESTNSAWWGVCLGNAGASGNADPAFTPMVNGDFAWINQGGASVTEADDTVFLLAPASAGLDCRIRKKSAPNAPYTITVAFRHALYPKQYTTAGLCFRQSSDGKLHVFKITFVDSNGLHITSGKFTNPTTFSADYRDALLPIHGPFLWFRIADDNTNRICSFSTDGRNFIQFHSVGRTDFLTADEVGIFVNSESSSAGDAGMTVYSWVQA